MRDSWIRRRRATRVSGHFSRVIQVSRLGGRVHILRLRCNYSALHLWCWVAMAQSDGCVFPHWPPSGSSSPLSSTAHAHSCPRHNHGKRTPPSQSEPVRDAMLFLLDGAPARPESSAMHDNSVLQPSAIRSFTPRSTDSLLYLMLGPSVLRVQVAHTAMNEMEPTRRALALLRWPRKSQNAAPSLHGVFLNALRDLLSGSH